MFGLISDSARRAGGGMNSLAIQLAAKTASVQAKCSGSPPSLAASPATIVPIRMAMNVAPSTSALPAAVLRAQMIGQDAVFDRAEQRGNHAERNTREQNGDRMKRKAGHRQRGDGDLDQL